MAKNVFFTEETMTGMDQIVKTELGRAAVNYGKGNFLLGAACTVAFGAFGWCAYETGKLAVNIVKYFKA